MIDPTFSRGLRDARIRARLSIIELAHLTGLSRPYLYNLEDDRRSPHPSAQVVIRLSSALGIPVEELMGAAAGASRSRRPMPQSLRDYLDQGRTDPSVAAILASVAEQLHGPSTIDDWQFLDGALRRSVIGARPARRTAKTHRDNARR